MKHLLTITFLLLLSCRNTPKTFPSDNFLISDTKRENSKDSLSTSAIDSLVFITADDYPVTNNMLEEITLKNESLKFKVGKVYSLRYVWFANDTLNQTLVFELYTDFHRLYIYNFRNDFIPDSLINVLSLYIATSPSEKAFKDASFSQKKLSLKDFIKFGKRINSKYFTTIKGINLDDKKDVVIEQYGQPDNKSYDGDVEILEWDYYGEGDLIGDTKAIKEMDLKGKSVVKNSFGQNIKAYFKDTKLIGIIITNDIP